MSSYWFKPKTFGYGAAPVDWRGWSWIGAFAAVDLVLTYLMVMKPALALTGPTASELLLWLLVMAIITVIFLYVCKIKTDGEWRWRSGKDK